MLAMALQRECVESAAGASRKRITQKEVEKERA